MNAAKLEKQINEAITKTLTSAKVRYDAPSREMLVTMITEIIGPFEDHVDLVTQVHGTSVVCTFNPKDEIGEALLRRMGIIPNLSVPVHEITFNVNVTPKT